MIDLLLTRMAARLIPNVINRGGPGGVYLTFDDGPDPDITPRLLDMLDAVECRVTFFVTGAQAERHPGIVKAAFKRGHSIGSHGYSHESLLLASRRKVQDQISRSISLLADITGRRPSLFRPPFGRFNPFLLKMLQDMGLKLVLWSVNPVDYREVEPAEIIDRAAGKTHDGDIILLHDLGLWAGSTLRALPSIIEAIRQKGLNLLPLPTDNPIAAKQES